MAALSLADALRSTAQLQPAAPKTRSARSRNRASAWAYDLAQWAEYRRAMAGGEAERAAIDAEYQRRLQEGPDFQSYHAGSKFADAPKHSTTKDQRTAMLVAFDQVRAWLYQNRRRPRGQAVSRVYREVLAVLANFAIKYGKVFPSQATIAKLASCSERTVRNALAWLRLWGFVTWVRRIVRQPGRLGAKVRQASNAYSVALSGLAAIGAAIFSGASGNKCRPSELTAQTRNLLSKVLKHGAPTAHSGSM